jgi:DNA-binding transcriptional MerR regulator
MHCAIKSSMAVYCTVRRHIKPCTVEWGGMADELTIDELARATGMTVRNIRAHQSRGLLPPPEVRARTGYYGAEHLERIRLIQGMQAEGFNLKSIQRIIEANGGGAQIIDFGRRVLGAFDEEPELTTADELAKRFGGTLDVKAMQKAQRLGLVRPLGDDRYEVASPTLMRAGEELVNLGIPLSHALAVAERIQRNSRPIAEAFIRLFVEDVIGPGDPTQRTPQEWDRVCEALERLRPLATEAVRAGFQQTMSAAVDEQVAKIVGGLAPPEHKGPPRLGRRRR